MCWSLLLHLSFHVVSSCCVLPCDPSDVACVGLYCSIFRSMWSVHAVLYHVIHLMFHVLFFMFHLSFHVFSSCGVLPCDPSDVACVGLYCSIFRSMWSVHAVFYHVIHLLFNLSCPVLSPFLKKHLFSLKKTINLGKKGPPRYSTNA